jgi:hypothetical protein
MYQMAQVKKTYTGKVLLKNAGLKNQLIIGQNS